MAGPLAVVLAVVLAMAPPATGGPAGAATPVIHELQGEVPALAEWAGVPGGAGGDAWADVWQPDGSAEERGWPDAPVPRMDPDIWGTDGPVHAVARGGRTLYIGGTFSSVAPAVGGGVPFDLRAGRVRSRFPKVNGGVDAVVPDGRGGWFIGGSFTDVDGLPRASLAHIEPDGSVSQWRADAAPFVFALLLKGDTLFVGGRFQAVGGQPRSNLAAVDARTGAVLSWSPNPNYEVHALCLQGALLYVGGAFYDIGGQHRTYLAALDVATGAATNWNPNPYARVHAIAANDSTVFAGGDFTVLAGKSRSYLAAIDARSGTLRSWAPDPNGSVFTLHLKGRALFALGWFNTIGGRARNGAAVLDAVSGDVLPWTADSSVARVVALAIRDRTVYAGWYRAATQQHGIAALDLLTGAALGWGEPADGFVNALALDRNQLYVGGDFSRLGEPVARRNLAALDVATGCLLPWDPAPDGPSVNALAVNRGTVYVGGDFARIGGRAAQGLAAVDGRDGRALRTDLGTDGVVEVLERSGTSLYVGGNFSRLGGLERRNLAAIDLDGQRVGTWDPGTNGAVGAMAVGGGRVYVGGRFDHVGGGTGLLPRDRLAALDATTGAVAPWAPGVDGGVTAMAMGGNTLYMGGTFTSVDGQPRGYLAAVDAITGELRPWDPAASWYRARGVPRHAMAVVDSTVYVGGWLDWIAGANRRGCAALDAGTAQATSWDPRTGFAVTMIDADEDALYLGGTFRQAGGFPANHLAVFALTRKPARRPDAPLRTGSAPARAPQAVALLPDPSQGAGRVRFFLSEGASVTLSVFDLQGRLVARLLDHAWQGAGEHSLDVGSLHGRPGLYLCRIEAAGATATGKLVVTR